MKRLVLLLLALLLPATSFADMVYIPPYGYYQTNDRGEYYYVGSTPDSYYRTANIYPYNRTYGQYDNRYGETATNTYNTFDYAAPQDRPNYYPNNTYNSYDYSHPSDSYYYNDQYYDQNNGYVRCTVTNSGNIDSNGNYRVVRTCTNAHGYSTSNSYDVPAYQYGGSYPYRRPCNY